MDVDRLGLLMTAAKDSTAGSSKKLGFGIDRILASDKPEEEEEESSSSEEPRFEWLQCTRYKPPKLQRPKKSGPVKRKLGRSPRVPFSNAQLAVMERKFRVTQYLSSGDVAELATMLGLTENRVKIWFQNRRARERREGEAHQQNSTRIDLTCSDTVTSPYGPLLGPVPPNSMVSAQFANAIVGGSSAFTAVKSAHKQDESDGSPTDGFVWRSSS